MPKKLDDTAQKFDHRAITNYESATARKLVARYDKLTKEREETQALQAQVETEVAQLSKGLKLANPSADTVSMLNTKRLQASMCPPRLEELEQLIEDAEADVRDEYDNKLLRAVQRLAEAERERVIAEIAAQIRPHCDTDPAARHLAGNTPRWRDASSRIMWYDSRFEPVVDRARRALARLDHYDTFGDLEKESAETAAHPSPAVA